MPLAVNTNTAAMQASFNLGRANESLQKSFGRLPSGKRITSPADDAGGLAGAYKLSSMASWTSAVMQNVQNSLSYLQEQDSPPQVDGKIIDRMADIHTMAQDITKSTGDIENYSKEFLVLQGQLHQLQNETFNGISVFSAGHGATVKGNPNLNLGQAKKDTKHSYHSLSAWNGEIHKYDSTTYTHPGDQMNEGSVSLDIVNLEFALEVGNLDSLDDSAWDLGGVDGVAEGDDGVNLEGTMPKQITATLGMTADGFISNTPRVTMGTRINAIEKRTDARTENGTEQNCPMEVRGILRSNLTNLRPDHGRIMDADIALDSTRHAERNKLVQARTAVTLQGNQLTNIPLTLLF